MMSTERFRVKPIAYFVGALFFSAPALHAQEKNDDIETIKVWGTQVDNSSSMLKDDIELKQADHLSDLLRDQPGVDIGGSHSMNQSINIRGVSELDLNISIDGVNQSNNVFHHVGNLLVNPDILQAVELQVGNNSVVNGGLGGGVAFETKDARDLLKTGQAFGARLFGGVASNDYHNYSGTVYSQLTDGIDALAYYSAIERDNPVDGDGIEMLGQEGKTENYLVKFGWDANAHNRLELSYDSYKDAGDYRLKSNMGMGWGEDKHKSLIRPTEYTRESIALNHELSLDDTDVRTTLYRNEMNYANTDPKTGDVGEGNTVVYGLKTLAETTVQLGGVWHVARYGIDASKQESKKLTNGKVVDNSSGVSSKETADAVAVFLEDEIELLDGWYLTPGVRYNLHKVEMAASDETFTDTTFGLATKYEINDQWSVRASATELFKGPALSGSYLASNSSYNEILEAETGINYEAGIAYEQQEVLGLDSLGFSFTVFETQIDDYIDDGMTGKASEDNPYRNLGDVEIVGFESVLSFRRGELSGRLTYARSDSEFTNALADSGYVNGQSLEDEVGDSISFNLGYDIPALGLSLSWTSLVTLDLDKEVEEDSFKEGYDVHQINVRWAPETLDNLTVTAGIENLFDEHYSSHASHDFGYTDYEPGRNYKLNIAYQF